MSKQVSVVLAGGGTGGHLFPGIALAGELQDLSEHNSSGNIRIVFAVSSKSLDREIIEENGFEMKTIGTPGWRGGVLRYPLMVTGIGLSFLRSVMFMLTNRCRAVIGLGGYASFGPILAGFILRKGIFLLEQNTVPGKANRFLSRFSSAVFIQFESSSTFFKDGKAVPLGNPVRREIISLACGKERNDGFELLVMGGSQGAKRLNEVFIEASVLIRFPEGARIVHLCGKNNLEECREQYEKSGLETDYELKGFAADMAALIGSADLCVCRSGATSIAELTCAGVPLIMIPYPYATDDHQYLNAREIEEKGAGICIREEDLTPDKLAGIINELITDRNRLDEMGLCSKEAGRPEAGPEIAGYIMKRIAG